MLKLGEIYLRDDVMLDEAERFLKAALKLDNTLSDAHVQLGRVYEKRGQDDLSMEEYKIGLKQSNINNTNTDKKINLQARFRAHFYLGC